MKVGVVILNYNSWKMSANLAKKMSSFSVIDEVVIVDNSSTDDSFERLQALKCSKIEVVESEKNGGYSYGNNFGAKILIRNRCDYLIISNPDVDIEERSISKILNAFENNKNFGVLSGIEYDIENNMSLPAIWRRNRYIDDLRECFYLGRKLKRKVSDIDYLCEIQSVEMVKGSFFVVKAKDFEEVKGFDENVFLFCEERILSRRMLDIGKQIGIVTLAKYNHNHSASIHKEYKSVTKQIKLLYKSRYYYNCCYNNINNVQKLILLLGMKISIIEYRFIDVIKKVRKRSR